MRAQLRDAFRPIAVLLLLAAVPLTACYGTTGYVDVDDGAYDADGPAVDPSPAFVATTEPTYYDGRPAYWYGNRWRYRQGGAWAHYRREPAPLHAARMQMGGQRGGGFRGSAPPINRSRGGAGRGGRWR